MRASLLTMAPASARGYFGVYTLPRGSEQVPNWSRVQRPVPNRFVLLRVAARGAGGEGAGDAAAGARLDRGAGRGRKSRPRRRRDSRGGLVRGGRDSSRRGERRRRRRLARDSLASALRSFGGRA